MDSTKILFYKTFDKQHFSEIQPEAGHIPERRGQMAKKNKPQNRISQRLIPQKEYLLLEDFAGIEIESGENIKPIDQVNGFQIRPGFYEINGASALPDGVNFTLI